MNRRLLALVWTALAAAPFARARAAETPALHAGAIESGVSGALKIVEGSTSGSIALDGAYFMHAPGGLASAAVEIGYSHVNELDLLDLSALVGWTRPIGETSLYPYLALGGGVRQEWIGSFEDARYPVGFDIGLRALVSPRADLRVNYRLRRVLDDPVEDFTEHEIRVGIALLFGNGRP